MIRTLWLVAGLVSLALGAAGVFLPLVPTVPFMLLAAFCFARSSERLHAWLLSHPTFGPPIADWRDRGAISQRAKRLATVAIVATFLVSVALGLNPWVLAIQGAVLAAVALFLWTRPAA